MIFQGWQYRLLESKVVSPAGGRGKKGTNNCHWPQRARNTPVPTRVGPLHWRSWSESENAGRGQEKKENVEKNKGNDSKQTKDSKTRGHNYDRCDESIRCEIKSRQKSPRG